MAPIKVAIAGATGGSGSTIVQGLLESPAGFDITTFSRVSSLNKPRNLALKELGVKVLPYDINGPQSKLVEVLKGFDVLISALGPAAFLDQIPLATAAKEAGVKRFVPAMYATCTPPKGVIDIREVKEDVINHVKKIGLPYTIIDVGWWYEYFILELPSGRMDYVKTAMPIGSNAIPGDGNMPSAMTAFRDVGRWVAQIVADPRTLNKMVFAYDTILTANQAFDVVEDVSGEKVQRNYLPKEQLLATASEARETVQKGVSNAFTTIKLYLAQYLYSWGVRGDNTPDFAKYLGYLDGKELYPQFKPVAFEDFARDALEGKARKIYEG